MNVSYKLVLYFFDGDGQAFLNFPKQQDAMSLQYLIGADADFLYADKHQGFLQININTLGIKDSHKVKLLLLMGMIKHS